MTVVTATTIYELEVWEKDLMGVAALPGEMEEKRARTQVMVGLIEGYLM